jgi:hypothetical protein
MKQKNTIEENHAARPETLPLGGATCSASMRDLLPPLEIIEAAATVAMWMDKMGYKNWQLGGVCDRRFAIFAGRVRAASEKWEDPILPNVQEHPTEEAK